ncbi:MAG: trypsin-like peptidase domain-containing protein [Pelagimonas sp.]|jgi:peptidoglycan hydrolase-like protein with peptidoglycan-binding domain|nr:trypsin-like peptidase domain-containing protein [Pelagimonas sp.]
MIKKALHLTAALCVTAHYAFAQEASDVVYIQVEARTSLTGAEQSVRDYAGVAPDVNGFSLGGGWYGVALGPYSREQAAQVLSDLRARGVIPRDSYIEVPRAYGRQFWPVGADAQRAAQEQAIAQAAQAAADVTTPTATAADSTGAAPAVSPVAPATADLVATETAAQAGGAPAQAEPAVAPTPEPAPVVEPVVVTEPEPEPDPEETPREARRSESKLTRDQRKELQIALQWAGYYKAAIDGAYGPGTRRSMSAWQEENGHDVTGVLTTRQRAQLMAQYNAVLDGMDLALHTDTGAGIEMQIPFGAVTFDRYEAPFALYKPTGLVPGARVLLVSQPGDRKTLNGLYEIMQTLEIVPPNGTRERGKNGFTLIGENDQIVSHTEVGLRNGELKGFTLIWPAGDEERRTRVLEHMKKDYIRTAGVLDPATITDAGQGVDLVSGLKVRKPKSNATGFFVESRGTVVTALANVAACERVTLNGLYDARVLASDEQLGLSVLVPKDTLAPRAVAAFRSDTPRLQSEVAVAGYSFGGVLTAPTLTFGTLQDLRGLTGEEHLSRLALGPLPGDVGGPVFDAGGSVLGMLLPQEGPGGRQLPDQVSFAAKGEMILDFLRNNGIQPAAHSGASDMDPEDLTAAAGDLTVLVSCW